MTEASGPADGAPSDGPDAAAPWGTPPPQPAGPSRRERLVAAARERWTASLIDLGGRNNLLYHRDLAVGTLDLAAADPQALVELHDGRAVRLSRLFTDPDRQQAAVRSARRIRDKVVELHEERGIAAGYLAVGMATWTEDGTRRPPAAPVLLRGMTLAATGGAQEDFRLVLDDEPELNPVLLHVLTTTYGVRPDAEELDAVLADAAHDPAPVYAALTRQSAAVPGFGVTHREVLGTFTYAKLPMVTDLARSLDVLVGNDVVAAVAGDPDAAAAVRIAGAGPDGEPADLAAQAPPALLPQEEFLVLDADSSQSSVIDRVVAGGHLVVKGPPGTGKSQTIANLVSTLVARGRTVLFVAEKRAAIDAVLRRLTDVDVDELVMDLHDGAANRRRVAESLAASLDQARRVLAPDTGDLHERLLDERARLDRHSDALHARREPWGVSVYQAQAAAAATPERLRSGVRLAADALDRVGAAELARSRDWLREYVQLGGLDPRTAQRPWGGSSVTTAEQAQAAIGAVDRVETVTLPDARTRVDAVLAGTGLPRPPTVGHWPDLVALVEDVADVLARTGDPVWSADLPRLLAATGDRAYRAASGVRVGFFARRRLHRTAAALWPDGARPPRGELHTVLVTADAALRRWQALCGPAARPALADGLAAALPAARAAADTLVVDLRLLAGHLPGRDPTGLDAADVARLMADLRADVATLYKLPRLAECRAWFAGHGLDRVVAEVGAREAGADDAVRLLEDSWHRSVLDRVAFTDPAYGVFASTVQDDVARRFAADDVVHRDSTPARVRRAAAEALVGTLNAHEDQARLVQAEAAKRRRHKPLRELWQLAPDVLLAVKPCWAMSPLVVSQVLPARELFDVVVFDEASQVQPADAVPSLMRGRRTVVAGDDRQLPPTAFFSSATAEEEAQAEQAGDGPDGDGAATLEVALTAGYESILDVLAAVVPQRSLTWHYRSRDERLVAFSNAHVYGSRLVTFPGVTGAECLRHVLVTAGPGDASAADAEARRVVDLVLEHAQTRPHESLGVITMGIQHAERVQAELLERLRGRPDLDAFFAEDRHERFFVKNLERVQGDERDAVLLSIGYGKGPDGRMRYRWGPLNMRGGERRLNVAITRSKRRMTVVSSFTAADVDPDAIRSDGAQMLRGFLDFAARGGRPDADAGPAAPAVPPAVPAAVSPAVSPAASSAGSALDALEQDVLDRLTAAGLPVTARYGVGEHRVGFAVAHPHDPARMVLAVETDGPAYRATRSTRDRDRLRPQHLRALGWTHHRLWTPDWFRDPQPSVDAVLDAHRRAVDAVDAEETAAAAAADKATAEQAASTEPVAAQPFAAQPFAALQPDTEQQPTGEQPDPPADPRGTPPEVRRGRPIDEYGAPLLRDVVRWVVSDGRLRTDEEIVREAMSVLGLTRLGPRIEAALTRALEATRR